MDSVLLQLKLEYCIMQMKMLVAEKNSRSAQEKEVYRKIMHTVNDAFGQLIPA